MSVDDQLRGLTSVLEELSTPLLTPHRKAEIEHALGQFKQQPGAWEYAIAFLQKTDSPYVKWYAGTVLEYAVHSDLLSQDQINNMQQFLLEYCQHAHLPSFVANKLLKVYVDASFALGPSRLQSFLDTVHRLSTSGSTCLLAMRLLHIFVEERVRNHILGVAAGDETHRAFLQLVPAVSDFLLTTLTNMAPLLSKGPGSNPQTRVSPSDAMIHSFGSTASSSVAIEADQALATAVSEVVLQCYANLIQLAETESVLTPRSVELLTKLASMYQTASTVAVAALRCFNELHVKSRLPPSYADYPAKAVQIAVDLMQSLFRDKADTYDWVYDVDEQYLDAFTEYLRTLVDSYMKRLLGQPSQLLQAFLFALAHYVMAMPVALLPHAAEVLVLMLDLIALPESCSPAVQASLQDAVGQVGRQLLLSCLHQSNGPVLQELEHTKLEDQAGHHSQDTSEEDESEEQELSEQEQFITSRLSCFAGAAEISPAACLDAASTAFNATMQQLQFIEAYTVQDATGRTQLSFPSNDSKWHVESAAHDTTTLCKAFSNTASIFVNNPILSGVVGELHGRVSQLFIYWCEKELFSASKLFEDLLAHNAALLQSLCPWLANSEDRAAVAERVTPLLVSLRHCILHSHGYTKVEDAASRLALALASTVDIYSLSGFAELATAVFDARDRLPLPTAQRFLSTLSIALNPMWHHAAEAAPQPRSPSLEQLFVTLAQPISSCADKAKAQQAIEPSLNATALRAFRLMSGCVLPVKGKPRKIQAPVAESVQSLVAHVVDVTPFLTRCNVQFASRALDFLRQCADVLGGYFGPAWAQHVLTFAMDVVTNLGATELQAAALESVLGIISSFIQSNPSKAVPLATNLASFIVNTAVPTAKQADSATLVTAVHHVIVDVLRMGWRALCPPAMDGQDHEGEKVTASLCQVLLDGTVAQDLQLVNDDLAALLELERSRKLLSKPLFINHLRADAVSSCLNGLDSSHYQTLHHVFSELLYLILLADPEHAFASLHATAERLRKSLGSPKHIQKIQESIAQRQGSSVFQAALTTALTSRA